MDKYNCSWVMVLAANGSRDLWRRGGGQYLKGAGGDSGSSFGFGF